MSQENVEVVYRAYDAIRRHDIEAFVREQHPDAASLTDWHPEVVQAEDYGDTVLAEVRVAGRGVRSGIAVEQNIWQVLKFRDGKAVSFHGYGSRAEALEAAGLAER